MSIITEWNALTTAKQIDFLKACTIKAVRKEIDGDINSFFMFHDLDGLVNEAWLMLADRMTDTYISNLNAHRAEAGKPEITLKSMVYRTAMYAIRRANRTDKKHEHGDILTEMESGSGREYIRAASRHSDETEAIAIGRIILDEFSEKRDDIDRLIIEAIRDGYTGRQAATAANISAPAISKRLKKLRADLHKESA